MVLVVVVPELLRQLGLLMVVLVGTQYYHHPLTELLDHLLQIQYIDTLLVEVGPLPAMVALVVVGVFLVLV